MGDFLAGALAGISRKVEQQNLLAHQEEMQRRQDLAKAYGDLAKHPNIRPEAAQDLMIKELIIRGTPPDKKLPKELSDITPHVLGVYKGGTGDGSTPQAQPSQGATAPSPIPAPPNVGVDVEAPQLPPQPPTPAAVPTVSTGVTGELPGASMPQVPMTAPPGMFLSQQELAARAGEMEAAKENARYAAMRGTRAKEIEEGRASRIKTLQRLGIDANNTDPETRMRIAEFIETGNLDKLTAQKSSIVLPPGATLVDPKTGAVIARGSDKESPTSSRDQIALEAHAEKLGKPVDKLTAREKKAAIEAMREHSGTTINLPPGMTTNDAVKDAARKVRSGEMTATQAFQLLGGVRGGMGPRLLAELRGSLVMPTKVRDNLNKVRQDASKAQARLGVIEGLLDKIQRGENVISNSVLLEGAVDASTAFLARANGEVGVLTDQDIARAKALIPQWKSANFAPELAREMIGILKQNQTAVSQAQEDAIMGGYFNEYDTAGGSVKAPPSGAGDRVKVKNAQGQIGTIPRSQLDAAKAQGYSEVK